jgi:hypothetical protein
LRKITPKKQLRLTFLPKNESQLQKGGKMKLSDLILKAVAENDNLNADEKKLLLEIDLDKINEELNSLKKSLEITVGERDSALKKLDDYVYLDNVGKIAADYKFSDKKYLEYLCRQNGIDCTATESFVPFMEELKKSSPKFFNVNLRTGVNHSESRKSLEYGKSDNDIVNLLKQAPELK